LLKEESEQSIGQYDRRIEIDGIGELLRGIRYDDSLRAGSPCRRDGNVGGEPAVRQKAPA